MSKFEVISFVFKNCVKGYYRYILGIMSVCLYWSVDLNFRSYIGKLVLDKLSSVPKDSIMHEMMPLIFIFFCMLFARFVMLRIYDWLWLMYKPELTVDLLNIFLKDAIKNSNVFFQKNISDRSNKIQEAIKVLPELVTIIVNNTFAHVCALLIALYSFSQISSNFFIALIFLIVCFLAISAYGYKYGTELSSKLVESEMSIFSQFNDLFVNIIPIRVFSRFNYEEGRLNSYYKKYEKNFKNKYIFDITVHALQSLIFIFYQCFCLYLIISEYQHGRITVGHFAFVFAMNREIVECLWYLSDDVVKFAEKLGVAKKLLDSLINLTPVKKLEGKSVFNNYDIEFNKVTFGYSDDKETFKDLSLKIETGKKVGIVGYSGSGKSTLVNLLLNFVSVKEGSVSIGGNNVNNISSKDLNSLVSIMTQDLVLFSRSIKENILYSNPDASSDDIIKAAQFANIHEFILGMEKQYDTVLENQGKELSYGQKQRILIARAFLKNSPILILDEVTSSLDNSSEKVVTDSLNELMEERTAILIAHKMKTLQSMDYLIVMDAGKIVEVGTHEELIGKKSYYYNLYNGIT